MRYVVEQVALHTKERDKLLTECTGLSKLVDWLDSIERRPGLDELESRLLSIDVNIPALKECIGYAEDGYQRQLSNYSVYFLWIVLVIISLILAIHLITSDNVSVITYVFVGIWILILFKYYYNQIVYYGSQTITYISNTLPDILTN